MKFQIFNRFSIKDFVPSEKTALIRISSHDLLKIKEELYSDILCLYFDDVDYESDYSITEDEIKKIISFFKNSVESDVDVIAVHCDYGESRSPAVAIALSEMFYGTDFGLRDKYLMHNCFVIGKIKGSSC